MKVSKPYGVVYLITNLVNGKYYVGQTKQGYLHRFEEHFCEARSRTRCRHLHAAMVKYGKDTFDIQEICEAKSKEELNRLEQLWIIALNSTEVGYNLDFGDGPGKLSHRQRDALSKTLKGRPLSQKHREAIRTGSMGKKMPSDYVERMRMRVSTQWTPEARAEMSEIKKAFYKTEEGTRQSKEHASKISRYWTPEARARKSLQMKAHYEKKHAKHDQES